jgi:hypothetical protein
MKEEIIYTEDYALIVSDEKIEKYDYVFNPIYKTLYQWIENADIHFDRIDAKKVIAHRPLTDAPILEGVPLLPEFEDDDFLNTEIQVVGDNKTMSVSTFLKKYGKETYKYTEEDLRRLVNSVTEFLSHHEPDEFNDWFEAKIQILQQPKRPKYFECEIVTVEPYKDKMGNIRSEKIFPKTITNPQGQTELVGEYIYE